MGRPPVDVPIGAEFGCQTVLEELEPVRRPGIDGGGARRRFRCVCACGENSKQFLTSLLRTPRPRHCMRCRPGRPWPMPPVAP